MMRGFVITHIVRNPAIESCFQADVASLPQAANSSPAAKSSRFTVGAVDRRRKIQILGQFDTRARGSLYLPLLETPVSFWLIVPNPVGVPGVRGGFLVNHTIERLAGWARVCVIFPLLAGSNS